ncbi:SDR family NAD(P)-dependent oxidoreductase [Streptomyces lancefieldiae]|uniref:SDR family NAD(P)-dependent oxidoreductase n=1 Tax=Streptomyces lancefieldiae TaxID=3075520 RepID=A0ABU3AR32_9ACTN|nr:SDR family NAD(P)-dependent oxidoreductase [Streptomyces sp. DSM 40712]MDT0612655.1 SDR family NAD(P)-dependent oxidoreductase [Streptomyces sp. DSM 40712]
MPKSSGLTPPAGRAVVITGASSGLGEACALHLSRVGFHVFAGVRRSEDGERLRVAATGRLTPVIIDVTDEKSVQAAVHHVTVSTGEAGLWGLVNNAGIAVTAPLECVPSELMRRQLDTNVTGQLLVIQGFLPLLRAGAGRIVNVTSAVGNVAIPYLGAYAAAQFAKEALSDALRRELAPQRIPVVVVQPSRVATPLWDKMPDVGSRALERAPEPVQDLYRSTFPRFMETNETHARASRTTPDDVARVVFRALVAKRPSTRYGVGRDATGSRVLARLLPDRAVDRILKAIVTPAR